MVIQTHMGFLMFVTLVIRFVHQDAPGKSRTIYGGHSVSMKDLRQKTG